MNDCTIIVFGASGDLSKRKLIPALYKLIDDKNIDNFVLIGAAIDAIDANSMLEKARPFIGAMNEYIWKQLTKRTSYIQLRFDDPHDFARLKDLVHAQESQFGLPGNRLFYCAAAAHFFCPITEHLAASGLAHRSGSDSLVWHRIVYEKPFGKNLASARELNACIAARFDEEQIYRVDHYLLKEIVSNIALVRFTNCVFEPLWNNFYVDQVQIILTETMGIEGRGAYYDEYGALCDVVQNHMLELLAVVAMESPKLLTGEYIRDRRAKALERVTVVDGVLGQYEGYRSEPAVNPESTTETFAALQLMIDNPRWAGVPFYLKTGKRLNKRETVINLKFKAVDCLLARNCPSEPNWLTISIEPDAQFCLSLNAKKPGVTDAVVPVAMEFSHSILSDVRTPQAYEILLEEIINGEQAVSVRFDEIEHAWKIIEQIKRMELPVAPYAPASSGPIAFEEFSRKHAIGWRL